MRGEGPAPSRRQRAAIRIVRAVLRIPLLRIPTGERSEWLSTFTLVLRRESDRGWIAYWGFVGLEVLDIVFSRIRHRRTTSNGRHRRGLVVGSFVQAFRSIRARPGYAATFTTTFAVGLALAVTLFSVLSAAVLRPLPFEAPERLVTVWSIDESTERDSPFVPVSAYLTWRGFSDILEGAAASTGPGSRTLTGLARPERIDTRTVTVGLFDFLGVPPMLGRGFVEGDGDAGGPDRVIIGSRLWERAFDRDPDALGKALRFDERSYTVVGIMPEGFGFPYGDTEAWFPVSDSPSALGGLRSLDMIARLRPGVEFEEAAERLRSRARIAWDEGLAPAGLVPFLNDIEWMGTSERTAKILLLLFGSAGILLLISTFNVFSLSIADVLHRRSEFSIRTALGAGRIRILGHLSAEVVLLSAVSAILAVWIANALVPALAPLMQDHLGVNTGGRLMRVWPDGVVFSGAAVALATLFLGLFRSALASRSGSRSQVGGIRAQQVLLAGQVALTMLLLSGAGLMVGTMVRLSGRDPGMDVDRLLIVQLTMDDSVGVLGDREATFSEIQRQLRTLQDVESLASTTSTLPLSKANFRPSIETGRGGALNLDGFLPYHEIGPDYLDVTGIEVVAGRGLLPDDRESVVINTLMAERLWEGRDPIGDRIRFSESRPWRTVVGVASDALQMSARDQWGDGMEYYTSISESRSEASRAIVVRTTGDPRVLIPAVERTIWALDPNQPIDRIQRYSDAFDDTVASERFYLILVLIFSGTSLVVAAGGVHALLTQVLARRRRELGIRLALGAGRRRVAEAVLRNGVRLTVAGIAAGLGLALIFGRFLESILFGVSASDPVTLGTQALLLMGICGLTGCVSVVRALRLDPIEVLRAE